MAAVQVDMSRTNGWLSPHNEAAWLRTLSRIDKNMEATEMENPMENHTENDIDTRVIYGVICRKYTF